MRPRTRSRITLSADELRMVQRLRRRLDLRTNVEVVRRGLRLLEETTEREALKAAYRSAALAARPATREEIDALDHLTAEGLD